jgi:hypothetical protein
MTAVTTRSEFGPIANDMIIKIGIHSFADSEVLRTHTSMPNMIRVAQRTTNFDALLDL